MTMIAVVCGLASLGILCGYEYINKLLPLPQNPVRHNYSLLEETAVTKYSLSLGKHDFYHLCHVQERLTGIKFTTHFLF